MADDVEAQLADGERLIIRARQHWWALVRFALQPLLILGAAFLCLALGMAIDGDFFLGGAVDWVLGLLTVVLFIVAIAWLPVMFVRWRSRRFVLTDRRVLYMDGVLRKQTVDAGIDKITDVGFQQGPLGRAMGFGDLAVATAFGRPLRFDALIDAIDFKKGILAAQAGPGTSGATAGGQGSTSAAAAAVEAQTSSVEKAT